MPELTHSQVVRRMIGHLRQSITTSSKPKTIERNKRKLEALLWLLDFQKESM